MAIKKEFMFTPRGTAEPYCAIQKPDYGNPEKGFGNPRGVYKVDLTVPSKDAQALINKINKLHEANYAEICEKFEAERPELLKKLARGKKLLEPYEGNMPYFINDDGTVTFKFSSYGAYVDKSGDLKPLVLKVVDSKGKRINNVPAISGGSELKARFSMFAYGFSAVAGASVKLQLDSVMLLKLVEFGGGDDEWGDEAEEGYVADENRQEQGWSDDDQRGDDDAADADDDKYGGDF